MFENLRKCLDDFEKAFEKCCKDVNTYEDSNIVEYFELHLAEELMKNRYCDCNKIARFIMAERGFEIRI